jgi:mRNA-degrading endonuclease toxin of MazEF toxin-antitoxin module
MTHYEFGDVVLVDFPQSGISQRKRRPALIILDIGDADVVLAPITTKERAGPGDYKLKDWSTCGLLQESWVRLAKVACLEKSNIARCLGRLTDYDKDMLAQQWQALYPSSPRGDV